MTEGNAVQEIRRATRRRFSAEEKIQIVLEELRGEILVPQLFRREGISSVLYNRWSKTFLDAGKDGLTVSQLYREFTSKYRSRGGTDYYINVLRPLLAAIGNM